MTEHDTTDHVSAIKAHLQSMVILSQLNEEDGSAFTEAFFSHYEDANRAADALAARLSAAEAERDAERARADSYKQGWDALGPFCTKQFRGDDPRITDEELHAFCVARRAIWDMEHGDLPTDGSDES